MMRKTLLAAALTVTAFAAQADYQCGVTPRDDVIISPQTVQVKGENGNLVITPDGNVMFNGKQPSLTAAQREQAKDYQPNCAVLCHGLTMARAVAWRKAVQRWIRSLSNRWERIAACATV